MKLCVFPNDPIIHAFNKGEIKERYYNPKNFFDEIHIISFIDKDIDEEKVQLIAGTAKLKIYSMGKINYLNKSKKNALTLSLIKEIKPDLIRSYNPLIQGWVAAKCSRELNIPLYVSLHVQYDGLRKIILKKNLKKYLALKYSRKIIEPFVLSQANKITIVYKIIYPYVVELSKKIPEIVYNRIDLKQFSTGKKIIKFDKPLILSVGRHTSQKNHECIIRAVKNLAVYLMIIGDGELYNDAENLIKKLGMKEKIILKKSIPNNQIQDYYASANLFVLAYNPNVEGVPIPVLEAMASGIPVLISKPIPELSDGLENSVEFAENNPKSFEDKIRKILEDESFAEKLAINGKQKALEFDADKIEEYEKDIYQDLLNGRNYH